MNFDFDFFGRQFTSVYVNNNGNLTFTGPFSNFVPEALSGIDQPILAPFWADVFTDGKGLGRVTYGPGTLDGDPAFGATWEGVARFLPDGTADTFQVVIVDHTARLGYYEVQFNYLSIQWDHALSSDAGPRVGYSNGAGVVAELPGSGTFDALLDTGSSSLRSLRRYTLIIDPSGSGSRPTPGDVFRSTGSAQRLTTSPPSATRSVATGSTPTPAMRTGWEEAGKDDFFSMAQEAAAPLVRIVWEQPGRGPIDSLVLDLLASEDGWKM